ncbi:hypothetical protein [Carboxylicivirga caseinilyticus]|uniref:hypothetical protein n=1 Tax=Carboxylicivirga caseinilyticus TaxID=3417572 RepID=UPI003D34153D|nr:hypothetical protein [Marinilabiliaceae bacterium A049]
MHILFLTTNNLATNPRLYKELCYALELGHQCTLLQFKLGNWSDCRSDELLVKSDELKRVQVINIDATPTDRIKWLKWGLLEKFAQKLYPIFKRSMKINALATSRRAFQLLHTALKLNEKPNLICAHNLGTLYPAWKCSQKWNIPFVFDVEDYHPGEFIRFDAKNEKKRREFLMKKLLPDAHALTLASPLISEYTLKLIGGHPNHKVILNSFPSSEFIMPKTYDLVPKTSNALRLVWFSQKISFGRGLEQLLEALTLLIKSSDLLTYQPINLTLIGDLDPSFKQQIIQPFLSSIASAKEDKSQIINLHIENPMSQPDLHAELANHDISLALEPGKDLNNNLAISNKIIAYAQAGLYILATDTPAQKQFMDTDTNRGCISGQTVVKLKDSLFNLMSKTESIRRQHQERFKRGKELAWEQEREKLITIWMATPTSIENQN